MTFNDKISKVQKFGDEKAITTSAVVGHKDNEGKTYLFYRFPQGDEAKEIQDFEGYYYNISQADKNIQSRFQKTFSRLEGIANVEFVNIDSLDKEGFQALRDKGVKVPKQADFSVVMGDISKGQGGVVGYSGSWVDLVVIDRDKLANENGTEKSRKEIDYFIKREMLMVMGLCPPEDTKTVFGNDKPALEPEKDNREHTLLSKNFNSETEKFPHLFGDIDVDAILFRFKKSQNLNLELEENVRIKITNAIATSQEELEKMRGFFETSMNDVVTKANIDLEIDSKDIITIAKSYTMVADKFGSEKMEKLLADKKLSNGLGKITLRVASVNPNEATNIVTDGIIEELYEMQLTKFDRKEIMGLEGASYNKSNDTYTIDLVKLGNKLMQNNKFGNKR
jgi:hypothetical protein